MHAKPRKLNKQIRPETKANNKHTEKGKANTRKTRTYSNAADGVRQTRSNTECAASATQSGPDGDGMRARVPPQSRWRPQRPAQSRQKRRQNSHRRRPTWATLAKCADARVRARAARDRWATLRRCHSRSAARELHMATDRRQNSPMRRRTRAHQRQQSAKRTMKTTTSS